MAWWNGGGPCWRATHRGITGSGCDGWSSWGSGNTPPPIIFTIIQSILLCLKNSGGLGAAPPWWYAAYPLKRIGRLSNSRGTKTGYPILLSRQCETHELAGILDSFHHFGHSILLLYVFFNVDVDVGSDYRRFLYTAFMPKLIGEDFSLIFLFNNYPNSVHLCSSYVLYLNTSYR